MVAVVAFYVIILFQGLMPPGTAILPGPPPPQPSQSITTEDAPLPGPSSRTQSTSGGNVNVVIAPATDEELKHAAEVTAPVAMDSGPRTGAKGMINLTNATMAVPTYLAAMARDRDHILNVPQVKAVNDALRGVGVALMLVSLALTILKFLASPFTGVDILDLPAAIIICLFFGFLGFFNQILLGAIIDIVAALLAGISTDLITAVIQPNLKISGVEDLIVVPVLAILYAVAALFLMLKIWSQWALLLILTAAAPIYITITGTPFLGIYGAKWWKQWVGTMIDPLLIIIGLGLLKAGMFVALSARVSMPDTVAQLLLICMFIPLIALPGWHAGAYGGGGLDVLVGAALFRAFRGRHHQPLPPAAAPTALPPAQPTIWPNPAGVGGFGNNGGMGGGNAAAWWKTDRWTPRGWTYARS